MTNILIVDDEKSIREDLASYLKIKKNFSTITASTLKEAISLIKEKKHSFEYAIIDLKLDNPSEYGGIQVYIAIKELYPSVIPIILSAYPFSEEIKEKLIEQIKDNSLIENETILLNEFKENYISKGGEINYLIATLSKLEEIEERKVKRVKMKKILLVDDTIEYCENFSNFFKRKNYEVINANTKEEALSIIRDNSGLFRYIIIDLQLDNQTEYGGIDVFLSIKIAYPAIKTIVVSGFLFEEVIDFFNKKINNDFFFHKKEFYSQEFKNSYIYKGSEGNLFDIIFNKISSFEPKEHFYALLIAINDYEYISKLRCPIQETHELKEVLLSHYSFNEDNIIMLEDATRRDIFEQLELLTKKLKENDSLIIFYSGHGYWDKKLDEGFWLTKNAEAHDKNKAEWITYSDIRLHLKQMDVKHILLINDTCFAGSITRNVDNYDLSTYEQASQKKSRKALTSGALHKVPSKSIFMQYLLQFLKDNTETHLVTYKLFSQIHEAIQKEKIILRDKEISLHPEYDKIPELDDEGGHFVFIRKSPS
ncbi:response regulator containing CheY-like receiver domain and AraC-type DNA-binding domain [Beggiatoa alba B18LD]|uniref:Response regulator containing CheY-like receiver domain and AraC-type DNA-binding domain n=1 Tax=Beggiatoa alba B18LD TaxID=395493 RepID=I3CGU0_9GAMM|nr:response regulator [Beggiatoa alba]EIJ42833.1 response regulator containing CheY-like receiver domain and AraC-type DNA-binding domain [Beggiatoa alba B18LD]